MTIDEIADSLPNGFHDAEITRIEIDYSARTLRIEMSIWVGSMDDPRERREAYRNAKLIVSGLDFCSMDLPDATYHFQKGKKIVIDAVSAEHEMLPKELLARLPEDHFVQTFFVSNWNSFIHVSGTTAELSWASEQIIYR